MSSQVKPSIVFAHGIWADGSCFNKVIPPLQAEGYEVASAQYGLDSNEADVAATLRTLGRVHSPSILVGHSYGGSVITAAGIDDRVVGLVYIAALAPDETETSQGQQTSSPSPRSSPTSRSPTDAPGCSPQAPPASPGICPPKSRK
ncbi:MAG TPA: alpha/beta hydrolase [Streptosporangiaceae bacterium]|nr:alpha/beta hydrolase [Streptosporangiaceae bacterium]